MTALTLPNFINGVETYDTITSFPTDDVFDGKVGIALDTKTVYVYDVGTTSWVVFAGGTGTTNHAAMSNLAYADAAHTGFEKALTFGAGLNRAVDTITVPTAGIKANMLQAAAADLGAANVEINLGNTNGAFVTNVTTDGSFSGLTYKIGATQVVGAQVASIGLDAKSDTDKITDIIAALRAHGLLGPNA